MDQKTGIPEPFDDEIECARYDEGIPHKCPPEDRCPICEGDEDEVVPYDDPRWDVDYDITIPGLRKWRYGIGGALTTNIPMPGVTRTLEEYAERHYGYKHFVAESIDLKTANVIAKLLDPDCESIEHFRRNSFSNA